MKCTKQDKENYKKILNHLSDEITYDRNEKLIPDGFDKIHYLYDILEKHCGVKYCDKSQRVVRVMDILEKQGISFYL